MKAVFAAKADDSVHFRLAPARSLALVGITGYYPMIQSDDPRLALAAIRSRYNNPTTYAAADEWHRFTATRIRQEIARSWPHLPTQKGHVILNAGAGDNDLGLCPSWTINLDISEARIAHLSRPIAASIEALPFPDGIVDTIICVGSVINYCNAAAAISEFGRVLRPGGCLILEFESSRSAELLFQDAFGRSAAISETFYNGQKEAIWVYAREYIARLLAAATISLVRCVPIQIVSPWILLLTRSIPVAALGARLDPLAKELFPLSRWASNYVLFCERRSD